MWMKNTAIAAALALMAGTILPACNTVRGVGKDVERAGEGVQDVADETQEEIREN